jgi:hypothetical protein
VLTKANLFYKLLTPFLIVVFTVNSGYGMYTTEESPVSMELCDHSNNESESEENETGKADDIFKHDHTAFSLISGITSDL